MQGRPGLVRVGEEEENAGGAYKGEAAEVVFADVVYAAHSAVVVWRTFVVSFRYASAIVFTACNGELT